jgi:hypothetical protein
VLEFRRNGLSTTYPGIGPIGTTTADDTVDDDDANIASSPFNSVYLATAADWQVGVNGTTTTCTAGTQDCVAIDRNTGLWWSEQNAVAGAAVNTSGQLIWTSAVSACDDLVYGAAKSDWRLPTQKELMQAYIDGFAAVIRTFPLLADTTSLATDPVWSATTSTLLTSEAWQARVPEGRTDIAAKASTSNHWFCVRP